MKRKIAGIWVISVMLFSIIIITIEIPMQVGAVMIYVDDDGGADYTTIQEAINAADHGDQVFVYSGTYNEQVVVNKTIDLIGEDANLVTIDGGGNGDTVQIVSDWANLTDFHIVNPSGSSGYGIRVEADNVGIYNSNISEHPNWALLLVRSNFCYIENNIFTMNGGIKLTESANNTISGNSIAGGGIGIVIESSSNNNTISDNTVSYNGRGIYVYPYINNLTISDNIITHNSVSGIHFSSYTEYNSITGNTISHNGDDNDDDGIFMESSSHNLISANTISSNGDNGIALKRADHTVIVGNTITSNNVGIYHWYWSHSSTIDSNIISDNLYNGIFIQGSHDDVITNNVIDDNGLGLFFYGAPDGVITNNVFTDDSMRIGGADLEDWNTHTIEGNTANGRAILYYKNQDGITVPTNAAQVILGNCSNFTVNGLQSYDVDVGIELGFSHDNDVSNNLISGNDGVGMIVRRSDRNTFHSNTITNNGDDGMWLYQSSYNQLTNTKISNNLHGLRIIRYSRYNNVSNNDITGNKDRGIYMDDGINFNNIVYNNISSNEGNGIFTRYMYYINISNNVITSNSGTGIEHFSWIWPSHNNTMSDNIISDNDGNGISLRSTKFNTISGNDISRNSGSALYAVLAIDNTIINNTFSHNTQYGVNLSTTKNNKVYHNWFIDNTNQAYDDSEGDNQWDNGYPSGGNYWSDYNEPDEYYGSNQDQSGADGFCDTPYYIDSDSLDRYPRKKDETPPSIQLNSPLNGAIIQPGITIELSITDINSFDAEYSLDEGSYITLDSPYDIDTSDWGEGHNQIDVTATDDFGNARAESYGFYIDSIPPEIKLDSPLNNSYLGKGAELEFTISDTNLNEVRYSVNSGSYHSISSPYIIETDSWSDGEYRIRINADDRAGNYMEHWYEFTKDTTLPEISLKSPDNDTLLLFDTTIDFDISDDNLETVSYSLNHGSFLTFEEPYDLDTLEWEDGDHIISIRVEDMAGNINEMWFSFSLDTSPPSTLSISPAEKTTGVDVETEITVVFSEPMDRKSVESAIAIIPYTEYECLWNDDNTSMTLIFSEPLEYNTYYEVSISTKAEDMAGHTLESKFEISFTTEEKPKEGDDEFPLMFILLMVIMAIVAAVVIVVLVASKKKAKPSPQMQVTSLAPPIPPQMTAAPIQPVTVQAPQMLQVRCSQCQNILQVKDLGVTMKITCPFCSTALTVQSQKTATTAQQPQAQQKNLPTVQQVSCPKCKTSFPVVKSEGPKEIQCPSCGLTGRYG